MVLIALLLSVGIPVAVTVLTIKTLDPADGAAAAHSCCDQRSIVKAITFIVKKMASTGLVIIQRASPSSPREAVIEEAKRHPRQQKRSS